MTDIVEELKKTNEYAQKLLEKHDGVFARLESKEKEFLGRLSGESAKVLQQIDISAKRGQEEIRKIIESTDLKTIGEEYKNLFDSKLKAIDAESAKMKAEVENAIKQAKSEIKAFDYVETAKPTVKTNPIKKYATWLDLTSGTIWVCVDNTKDKNKWVSGTGSLGVVSFNKVDIFNDGSCIAYFPFKRNLNELAGRYTISKHHSSGSFSPSFSDANGAYFQNDRYGLKLSPQIRIGSKFSISFKGKSGGSQLDGSDQYMFQSQEQSSWDPLLRPDWNGTIYLNGGSQASYSFKINDGNWHHYVLVGDGSNIKLYIDDVYKTQTKQSRSTYNISSLAGGRADNFNSDAYDGWAGYLKNIRFFNRVLTPEEIKKLGEEQ